MTRSCLMIGEIPSHMTTMRGEFLWVGDKLRGEVPWAVKEILVKSRVLGEIFR